MLCKSEGCTVHASFGLEKIEFCFKHKPHGAMNRSKKSRCEVEGCVKNVTYTDESKKAKRCAAHKLPEDHMMYASFCEVCHVTALFNIPGKKKGVRCAAHKVQGMVPVRGRFCKLCSIVNPCFGFTGEKGTHCLSHKLEGQVNVEKRLCEVEGCETTATLGIPGSKKPIRCSIHAEDGMNNLMARKCENCNLIASFGLKGSKRATHCMEHASLDMTNVTSKRCLKCDKIPAFGDPRTRTAIFCTEHAENGMINLKNFICEKCPKIACYGIASEKARFCKTHAEDRMVNVISKKCIEPGCTTVACFNNPGTRSGIYCITHSKEGMINPKRKICKIDGCETTGWKKYEGYCAKCHVHVFPDAVQSRNWKTKERAVGDFLFKNWPESIITHDKQVNCSKFRPDFVIDLGSHTIVVEVDEDQHERYDTSCENKRLMSIFQGLGNRPMIMIRFNPDKYIDEKGEKVVGCWQKSGLIRQDYEWMKRLRKLKSSIEYWFENIPDREVTTEHLFYSFRKTGTTGAT